MSLLFHFNHKKFWFGVCLLHGIFQKLFFINWSELDLCLWPYLVFNALCQLSVYMINILFDVCHTLAANIICL